MLPLTIIAFLLTSVCAQGDFILPPDEPGNANVTFTSSPDTEEVFISFDEEAAVPISIGHVNSNGEEPTVRITTTNGAYIGLKAVKDGNGKTFTLSVTKMQDYEVEHAFNAEISVGRITWTLYIDVRNINDNPTVLTAESQTCTVDENWNGNTSCMILAKDEDGLIKDVIFTVSESNNLKGIFYLEISGSDTKERNLWLMVRSDLDYEKRTAYSLNVSALDGDNLSSIPIVLQVNDVADQKPVWSFTNPVMNIPEDEPYALTVEAHDGDTGIKATILYKLHPVIEYFKIDPESGRIDVKPIDRDIPGNEEFHFNAIAYEKDDPGSNATLELIFMIQDKNDNKPVFNLEQFNATTPEGSSSLKFNTAIIITDPDLLDNGTYSVSVEDISEHSHYKDAFSVIPNQGYQNATFTISVTNSKYLDYESETWRNIHFKLVSRETADESHISECDIFINLTNENDEYPEFNETDFHADIMENAPEGHFITQLGAVDKDSEVGNIDRITFSTSSTSVKIDEVTGVVTAVKGAFDYEIQQEVIVQVTATDSASHSNYTHLTITVLDMNDVAPTLNMPPGPYEVNETDPINQSVTENISARDPDHNALLLFSINWKKSSASKNGVILDDNAFIDSFKITKNDLCQTREATACATVAIAKELNWDTFDSISLSIVVTDNNTDSSKMSEAQRSATMFVSIKDVNNRWPEFKSVSTLSVQENSPTNTKIGKLEATDKDTDTILTYWMEEINDTPPNLVKIDPKTAELSVGLNKAIDREEYAFIMYNVTASDGLHNTTVSINISVADVNDESPQLCNTSIKTARIIESPLNGSYIGTVCAYDKDATAPSNTVSYFLDDQYPSLSSLFSVDINSGNITVNCDTDCEKQLDREKYETYEIHIVARDNYQENSEANSNSKSILVDLTLDDINDERPQFTGGSEVPEKCQGGKEFPETLEKNDFLFTVTAFDKDKENTIYSQIQFHISKIIALEGAKDPNDDEPLFSITTVDYARGDVKAGRPLLGYFGRYNITVTARDLDPDKIMSNEINYTICIKDINDNSPVIVYPPYNTSVYVYDTQRIQHTIITQNNDELPLFNATDEDGGENGHVTFEVVGSELAKRYFYVNNTPGMNVGELLLRREFDLQNRRIEVIINATDNGQEIILSDTSMMTFYILTNETNDPYFEAKEDNYTFKENTRFEINFTGAFDVDNVYKPPNLQEKIYYFIVSENQSLFSLDKETTILKSIELDYETKRDHIILIKATNDASDSDLPSDTSANNILNITIYVDDENDCPPEFEFSMYASGISPADDIDNSVLSVKANDQDTHDKVSYTIMWDTMQANSSLQGYVNSSFNLDPSSGKLTLGFKPQSFMSGYFSFNIKAEDNAHHEAEVLVRVYIVTPYIRENLQFNNTKEHVEREEKTVQEVLTKYLNYKCNIKSISPLTDSEGKPMNKTNVVTIFTDLESYLPVEGYVIDQGLNDYDLKIAIKEAFSEKGLMWMDLTGGGTDNTVADASGLIQTVLIVVSALLATLVVLLLATFFFKTRSLNRRLEALSQTRFGSQDSGLNRVNMNVPNTNQHALEGSNPVWNEDIKSDDNISQGSGDSELVGIEDNPEFKPQDNSKSRRSSKNPYFSNDGLANGNITKDESEVKDDNFSFGQSQPSSPTTEL